MDERKPLESHVLKIVDMSKEELDEFTGAFKLRQIKKRQFIVQPDFISNYRTYVVNGAFRSYVTALNDDHTIQFALDDWWVGDINSYIYQQPATMFVVAIEDSSILQIDFVTEQKLKATNHKFETFFRISAERTSAYHQRRIISALTRTAEERYDDFMAIYGSVSLRLPQYVLASYLGMTTQFLSKIRNSKAKKR